MSDRIQTPGAEEMRDGATWVKGRTIKNVARAASLYCPDGSVQISKSQAGTSIQARGRAMVWVSITGGGPGNPFTGDVRRNPADATDIATGVEINVLGCDSAVTAADFGTRWMLATQNPDGQYDAVRALWS